MSPLKRIWDSETVFIVGGGPSIKHLDFKKLENKSVVVTNNAYKSVPWASALFFADRIWYDWNKSELYNFKNYKVTTDSRVSGEKEIIYLPHEGPYLSTNLSHSRRYTNSGSGAMALAVKLGATKLILLGFDMRVVDGKFNYHSEHKREPSPEIYKNAYIRELVKMKPFFEELGITVINCTPNSALECFPMDVIENWL